MIDDEEVQEQDVILARYALVVANFVSRIVADPTGYDAAEITIIASETAQVGDYWNGEEFEPAPPKRRYAVVVQDAVVNVIDAPEGHAVDGAVLIASETAQIGQNYADGVFTDPPAPPVTRAQVDAERDRRTEWGFTFNSKSFRLDEAKSVGRITAMGADARFAIAGGAQPNDYFWADPENPFGFIATDNSVMPMDAQTMRDFANAAKLWVSRHTFAGLTLKSMPVIPADFADDSYWPAAE